MIEPAPPWISLLLARVGLAAIVALETIWAGLMLANNPLSWDSRFWGSYLPLIAMLGIALLVWIGLFLGVPTDVTALSRSTDVSTVPVVPGFCSGI